MPELHTRQPTGRIAFPLILVEGEEKGGKSYASYRLSASPRVGRTFVLDLTDGTADEYASLGPYEILEHNGTFSSMADQVEAATLVPSDPDRPNVIIVDSGTALWNMLVNWTDQRARNSRGGKRALAADPDAEIDPSMNLWNDAKARWAKIIQLLRLYPGIGIITAQGKEVSKVENGVPVANQTEWKVEAEKSTQAIVQAWVRMTRPHRATLIAARSLHVEVPAAGLDLGDRDGVLDHVIFDLLGGGQEFGPSQAIAPQVGVPQGRAKGRLLEAIKRAQPTWSDDEAKTEAARLWTERFPDKPTEVTEAELHEVITAAGAVEEPNGQNGAGEPSLTDTPDTTGSAATAAPEPSGEPPRSSGTVSTPEDRAREAERAEAVGTLEQWTPAMDADREYEQVAVVLIPREDDTDEQVGWNVAHRPWLVEDAKVVCPDGKVRLVAGLWDPV